MYQHESVKIVRVFCFFDGRGEETVGAKAMGDENVYLIDCYGCFGVLENGECGTIDDCHPNSLGFYRMAERVYPLLNKLLNGEK